jgi:hypothetical protein
MKISASPAPKNQSAAARPAIDNDPIRRASNQPRRVNKMDFLGKKSQPATGGARPWGDERNRLTRLSLTAGGVRSALVIGAAIGGGAEKLACPCDAIWQTAQRVLSTAADAPPCPRRHWCEWTAPTSCATTISNAAIVAMALRATRRLSVRSLIGVDARLLASGYFHRGSIVFPDTAGTWRARRVHDAP